MPRAAATSVTVRTSRLSRCIRSPRGTGPGEPSPKDWRNSRPNATGGAWGWKREACAEALNANLNARLNDCLNGRKKFAVTPVVAPPLGTKLRPRLGPELGTRPICPICATERLTALNANLNGAVESVQTSTVRGRTSRA